MNRFAYSIGMGFLVGVAINLILTFFVAYFAPNKAIYLSINSIGEANIELVMILFCLPFTYMVLRQSYRSQVKCG